MTWRDYVFIAALAAFVALTAPDIFYPEPDCMTDTECMAFCPPPADDPECDGGPQQ